ncbi:MAG: glycosyltransferase [Desulfovibrio sp.]|jgi:glycosyltransferase involved in cell wall biosynthesis|nr:glycosyltransferase [Desulfovibrio sp.]
MSDHLEAFLPSEDRDYLVSAIVSVYKAERFLAGCLDDLLAQTIADVIEIVIVDSCSPQNERAIIDTYLARHGNITYLRTPQRENVYAAWNRGAAAARGRYLTNANSDDRHHPACLGLLANALEERPDRVLAYGTSFTTGTENETFGENDRSRPFLTPTPFAPATLLYFPFGPQPMWRRDLHDRIGPFDATYSAAGDWDFAIRASLVGKVAHVPEAMGLYLAHQGAITFRDDTMRKENERIRRFWRRADVVEQLYAMADAPLTTPEQQADVHHDMGLRALEFLTPWSDGAFGQDADFARRCFLHALRLAPGRDAPRLSLAIIDALRGDVQKAVTALDELRAGPCAALAERNLRVIARAASRPGHLLSLRHAPSPLGFPSQLSLAAAHVADIPSANTGNTGTGWDGADRNGAPRVLLFGESFPPSQGAAAPRAEKSDTARHMEELGAALAQSGYTPHVVTGPGPDHAEPAPHGITITETGLWDTPGLPDLYRLDRLAESSATRAALLAGPPGAWLLPACRLLRKHDVRTVLLPSISAADLATVRQGGDLPYLRFALACADEVVRGSESGCDAQVLHLMGATSHFVPRAVLPAPAPGDFRRQHGLAPDIPLLVAVAGSLPENGLPDLPNVPKLLDVLHGLAHDDGQWQLAIIGGPTSDGPGDGSGDGPDGGVPSRAHADPRVHLLGPLPRPQVQSALRDADILLLPGGAESALPYAALEAMALGTPWIATPRCTALADAAGGLIAEPDHFPQAIRALLRDADAATALGALGAAHWDACLRPERCAQALATLLEGAGSMPDLRMPASLRRANAAVQARLPGTGKPQA